MTRPIHAALAVSTLLLCLLAGCAAEKSYRDAQTLFDANRTEEALAEYRRALQSEPTNAKYRIGYLNARDKAVARWIDEAERLRRSGDKSNEARALFTRVLSVDEGNSRAQTGLAEVDRDQRLTGLMSRATADFNQGNTELALTRLREVLAERPTHAAALALRTKVLDQRAKPKANVDAKLAEAFRRPVSLEFRDAQLKQVFEVLSRSSGLNFVLDKDVRGDQRTTLFLRNTTISDAVALALLTNQLEQRVLDGNTILIFPNTPAKVREYQQLTVKSFVLSSADAKAVAATLKTILKAKDVTVDEKQNMILMRDSPEALQMAEKIVALHDQPEAEVMLDVEILEIKRSRLLQFGVQYPSQVSLAPMTSASGVPFTISDLKNIRASNTAITGVGLGLQATSTISDINVLANPRIRSRNREKAKIQVGQRVPNITSTSTSTGFVAETVQYVDVGLKLEVEPTVSPDGEVAIKVGLEVSNILRQIQTKGGSIAYEIGTRNANTVLRLRDGENQVLAGLINDEDRRTVTGLPGLASVPVAGGSVFGNTQDDYQKSEIVLSITPRIVRAAFRPDLAMSEFESGTEANLRSRGADFNPPSTAPPGGPVPARATSAPAAAAKPPQTANAESGDTTEETSATAAPPAADTSPAKTPEPRAPGGPSSMSWRGSGTATVGGDITVELWASTAQAVAVVPLTISYDPRVLSVVSVDQGNFMTNTGTASTLSKRAEAGSGLIRAVLSAPGGTTGPSEGSVVRVTFRALSASDSTRITLTETVKAVTPTGELLVLSTPPEWLVNVK